MVIMDRTAYICGENVRILAHVENRQEGPVWMAMRLTQHVEYFVEKNASESRNIACVVLESKTSPVDSHTQGKFDTAQTQAFVLPVVPPTMIGVCRLLQIFYVFRACIEDEKGNQALHMEFPLTIATLPFRKTTMPAPLLDYDVCCTHVEGGRYISPEFRLGHIYDGQDLDELSADEDIVLYRPLYVRLAENQRRGSNARSSSFGRALKKSASMLSGTISQSTLMTVRETTDQCLERDSTLAVDDSSYDKTDSQKPLLSVAYSSS